MRVLVWNMSHRIESWNSLERLNANIALLNEARGPSEGLGERHALGGERTIGRDGYDRPWATAVVSSFPLREIDDALRSERSCPVMNPTGTMPYFLAAFSNRRRARSRAASSSNETRWNRLSAARTCASSWIGRRRRPWESMYANALSGRLARSRSLSRAICE